MIWNSRVLLQQKYDDVYNSCKSKKMYECASKSRSRTHWSATGSEEASESVATQSSSKSFVESVIIIVNYASSIELNSIFTEETPKTNKKKSYDIKGKHIFGKEVGNCSK